VVKAKLLNNAPMFKGTQEELNSSFSPQKIKNAMIKLNIQSRVLSEIDIYNLIEHINGSRY